MKPMNLLVIMDDEHNKKVLGCYGHPIVRTPNLDRLAARGTRFSSAYTNSPICVPSRAAFATGRYVHQTGYWDNAQAYDGRVPSWGHRLQEAGHRCVSIGKLHYVDEKAPTGFDEQVIPMHIEEGVGDLFGLLRDPLPVRYQSRDLARRIGPGETTYIDYDRKITDYTCRWLKSEGAQRRDKPWMLFCSFISPHSPLVAPPEYYEMYPLDAIELPKRRRERFAHPWWDALNRCYIFDESFESDHHRKVAIASYLGLCSFIDANIGKVLAAFDEAGLTGNTRVAFVSDHGANLGARGLWGKSNMYEESAGVPLIIAGPDVRQGEVRATPVSLVDFYPTILDAMGLAADDPTLPGRSLFDIAREPDDRSRTVFSEYHAAGSLSACYMLREGRFKYVHYTGFAPELYDLESDPEEMHDLAAEPAHRENVAGFERRLRQTLDPEAVDRRAKRDQTALIQKHGGPEPILRRGGRSYTPTPGEQLEFINH